MTLFKATATLARKNLLVVLVRHSVATTFRSFIIPIALFIFLTFARNLFVPAATFGIGSPAPIKSLPDALAIAARTDRTKVVFVNNGFTGGQIDRVISNISSIVTGAGATAQVVNTNEELATACQSTLRGVTHCYGAVVFLSSPNEGPYKSWSYVLRSDGSLATGSLDVTNNNNDAEVYSLPLQKAIDSAIIDTNGKTALPTVINEYPFTSLTQQERADKIRNAYQGSLINFLGVAFIAGMIGVCYHLTGFMATERELGMSTLIEAMMPTRRAWQAQWARLLSYHFTFAALYAPGWIIGSLILWGGVFRNSNAALVLFLHLFAGLALTSMAILGASIFKKAQLSGVTVTIVFILTAILAQTLTAPSTAAVIILSLLFTPAAYVYSIHFLAHYQAGGQAAIITQSPPASSWAVPGIVLWIFMIIQIFAYLIIGAYIERKLFGTTTHGRQVTFVQNSPSAEAAVRLDGFTKVYAPNSLRKAFSFLSKPREAVRAVDGLSLTAGRGQILALLGANGSGKSTTLDAIAGTNRLTSGQISIDGTGGLGIAPQKNVLWDELTVEEHIRIFNQLKAPTNRATKEETLELIRSVDLTKKRKAKSKTLSGGQKRKLQLGMMLTGGSAVCCVDEVSSGLDPLSRRKIWDILLAERGRRTIIMTTHFLDEADLLADHIAILSKGQLRAEGSSVVLKETLGGGYRVRAYDVPSEQSAKFPNVVGVQKHVSFDTVTYVAPSSALAAEVIRNLERLGFNDYGFSGPTIEDVFLRLAEEIKGEEFKTAYDKRINSPEAVIAEKNAEDSSSGAEDDKGLGLHKAVQISYARQVWVLLRKRATVLKHNWFPYFAAFAIPVVAAGLVALFVVHQQPVGCDPSAQGSQEIATAISNLNTKFNVLIGPNGPLAQEFNATVNTVVNEGTKSNTTVTVGINNTWSDFQNSISSHPRNYTPGGLWFGDASQPPTMAVKYADSSGLSLQIEYAIAAMNMLDISLGQQYLNVSFSTFDIPWAPDTGNSLQLLVYLCLGFAAFPGFFALYPNIERRRSVRGLQYSNGVRPLPLWIAYVLFDWAFVVVAMAIVTIIFATVSTVWYHVGYLYVVFIFYGLASILLGYVISLFSANQLSTYAFTAAGQAIMFLIYLIAYLVTITYAPQNKIDNDLLVVNFVVSVFAPIGSVVRAMFLTLNLFSATCDGHELNPNPGSLVVYGGPILYTILQSVFLFALLIWLDSGDVGGSFRRLFGRKAEPTAAVRAEPEDEEVANELTRVTSTATGDGTTSSDGLQVKHLTKTFKNNTAVDNVTFGIKRGEVFALLGPNGAGKSTTISLIRGDIKPSGRSGGDVFVEDISVSKQIAAARSHLGVCPQFDAIDQMTVREHLHFYARARGIRDTPHQVSAILRAVGLAAFETRMANDLSGGNKRKLSLGIALMGNPTVVLLDEPSSGLDAAAKRVMWHTLAATVAGRSILLTTHSMEEADALASRAGILAKRMLAMGTTEQLRARFGDALHVHLICKGAPRTSDEDTRRLWQWVQETFPEAVVEDKTYHGQMRFSVPASDVLRSFMGQHGEGHTTVEKKTDAGDTIEEINSPGTSTKTVKPSATSSRGAVGQLVVMLEENKERLGIEHYSVSPTTLDQVFLTIVGQHNVQEENYEEEKEKMEGKRRWYSRKKR